MTLIDKATIMQYHRHRMGLYGHGTPRALGWKDAERQQKRFAVLSTVDDLTGCSVLDVGCGYGDLKGYLDHRFTNVTYIGIDQQPECISEAMSRYGDRPRTRFFQTDFTTVRLPEMDVVIASGILSYRCGNPHFYGDMIEKLYRAATHAMAFNILDAQVFPADPLLVGHDPEQVRVRCQSLTPHVRVIRGYLEEDVTLCLYRNPRPVQEPAEDPSG